MRGWIAGFLGVAWIIQRTSGNQFFLSSCTKAQGYVRMFVNWYEQDEKAA